MPVVRMDSTDIVLPYASQTAEIRFSITKKVTAKDEEIYAMTF